MSARAVARLAIVLATVLCAWLTESRLRLASDLAALFPSDGEAATLARWTRAFGGRDPVLVLVRGDDPTAVGAEADALAELLRTQPSIARVIDRTPRPTLSTESADPTLAWSFAGPAARARLAEILSPAGMHARLAETRALLLTPGAGEDVTAWLARDPLRLAQVPWESRPAELLSGVAGSPGAVFEADGGRARLVVAEARGSAFESEAAHAVVADVRRAEAQVARPGVTAEMTGGHAIAVAMERLLRTDLEVSSVASALLASLAFAITFRRVRALAAVLPPLALGTLWTTGLAALLPSGVDGIAIAFAAVVVGVGVDTGVHVYEALLDARRAGLAPHAAADEARRVTGRPTLTAAAVAALAFASLGLGHLRAMRELGLLCGAGELLTAIAILLVTPEIGAWMETGAPPPARHPRWSEALARWTSTRRRAAIALAVCFLPVIAVAVAGWPRAADALVAIRPAGLEPFAVEDRVRALFGGRPGQWIILDRDADAQQARARADRLAEALEPLVTDGAVDGFDSLAALAPSRATLQARIAARDALDLPSRRGALEQALRDEGFDLAACEPALDAFAHPAPLPPPRAAGDEGDLAWLLARHVARDGDATIVATYVRPSGPAAEARVRAAIQAADPTAEITSLQAIERALRDDLPRDLLVVGGASFVMVALAMRLALRSARGAVVALATLVCEMAMVGLAMRLLGVKWHVYDALVVPVLFGVTIDESMFLLHAARERPIEDALRKQGPLVAATALTTAAGFAALVACRYQGLSDLGAVGAIGVLAGLVAALVVVPAALRVFGGVTGDNP